MTGGAGSADGPAGRPRDSVDAIVDGWRAHRAELDVAPVAVVARLARVRAHIDHALEALFAEHGLTSATFSALAAISRLAGPHGVSQVTLMRELQLTSGTVSVRIDRLVAEGLARRDPDPGDRRGARVVLTERGRAAFEAAAPAHLENERRLLAGLAEEERVLLADLLRILLVEYEGHGPPAGEAPALGLLLASAPESAAERGTTGGPAEAGLVVRAVLPGGGAEAAGIAPGDVLVGAGGRPVRSVTCLLAALDAAGEALEVVVRREGRALTLTAAPGRGGSRPARAPGRGEHLV